MSQKKVLQREVEYMVEHLLKNGQGDLELEARIGEYTHQGFVPGFKFENYDTVERLLTLLRKGAGFQLTKCFTLKSNYKDNLRMISNPNSGNFHATEFQRKTRLRVVDFECPQRGTLGLRLCLAREAPVAIPANELVQYIPTSIVLRNRQEFEELVDLRSKDSILLKAQFLYHITKVTPPRINKMECSKVICSFQVEVELGRVEVFDKGMEMSDVAHWVAKMFCDRCMVCLGGDARGTLPSTALVHHREEGCLD